ncbi:Bpu10I family restriction endonuclease, partial [candidate division KSB1 bacterium]
MSFFIHGDNIENKIRTEKDSRNQELLEQIKERYIRWKNENLEITGTSKSD